MGRLTGKIAIVTGAASGIGAASAKLFADEGAQVLAVDRPESAIGTAHAGNDAIATCAADITTDDAPKKIVSAALEKFGGDSLREMLDHVEATRARWQELLARSTVEGT